jgi:hypothetical protein
MPAQRREEFEQRLIDHEVRRGRVDEAREQFTALRESRWESRSSWEDWRWYRRELIAMLAAAGTEAELRGLGLSDEVIREARLGATLLEAWARFHLPQFAPSPASAE